jgi:hypothetical protein
LRAARAPVGVVTAMHPLARTGGIAAAQVIVTTAVLMVVYRLVTHAFGLAALGLWGSAAALASLVVIADGGLADLMVRQIAEAAGRLEWARARGLHRALTLSSIAGLAAGALAVVPLVREVLGAAVPAARGAALDGLVTGATLVGCLSPIATAQLGVLEALLVADSANRKFMPTLAPVVDGWFSSNFGYRIDPFSGMQSFHEGIDFPAETGTPVVAAASGKVVESGYQPQYGKIIAIDHGNGLVSRYAHASEVYVNEGDLVVRGQRVASVGSTGRSTGPHLHFEVRLNGVPQNPARFLRAPS